MFSPNMLEWPLNDKEAKTVLHGFTEIVKEFKRTPSKLWVVQ